MPDPSDIPLWLNQRRYGQPLAARTLVPMNNPAQGGGPPSVATWPAECSPASRAEFAQMGPWCFEKCRGSLTSTKPSPL
eukprot:2046624-Pyramimonas_sp.AAC.1